MQQGLDFSLLQEVICLLLFEIVKCDGREDSFLTEIFSTLSLRELPGNFGLRAGLGQVFSVGR